MTSPSVRNPARKSALESAPKSGGRSATKAYPMLHWRSAVTTRTLSMLAALLLPGLVFTGCTEEVGNSGGGGNGAGGPGGPGGPGATTGQGGEGGIDIGDEGTPLAIEVPEDGRVFVDLDTPEVLSLTEDEAETNTDWELAFEGFDVFTNSGVSGPGTGGAFGPYPAFAFLSDSDPGAPFMVSDATGGAFLNWFAYQTPLLWSRFHVYGVEDVDGTMYKVQVLSYYGELQGAPVSAYYRVRWAEVTSSGAGPTFDDDQVDGIAGGLMGGPDDPSGCLDLSTGNLIYLTVTEAFESTDWHLCFRRSVVSVNGGLGGPRGVTAVDINRTFNPEGFDLETYQAMTAESELGAFDDIDLEALEDPALEYRGDRIVSAFDGLWLDPDAATPAPSLSTWVVQNPATAQRYLMYAESFEGATDEGPGTVNIRVKAVSGP